MSGASRFAPAHTAVRSGRGHSWGGSFTYEVQLGINLIVTLEKQWLNMTGNLV
jgi:hypothetical protein